MRVSFSLWPIRSTAEPAHGMWWLFRIAVPDDFLGQDRCVVIDAQDEFFRDDYEMPALTAATLLRLGGEAGHV